MTISSPNGSTNSLFVTSQALYGSPNNGGGQENVIQMTDTANSVLTFASNATLNVVTNSGDASYPYGFNNDYFFRNNETSNTATGAGILTLNGNVTFSGNQTTAFLQFASSTKAIDVVNGIISNGVTTVANGSVPVGTSIVAGLLIGINGGSSTANNLSIVSLNGANTFTGNSTLGVTAGSAANSFTTVVLGNAQVLGIGGTITAAQAVISASKDLTATTNGAVANPFTINQGANGSFGGTSLSTSTIPRRDGHGQRSNYARWFYDGHRFHAPGTVGTVGSLTLASSLTWNGGSSMQFDLNTSATNSDLLTVGGALTKGIAGTYTFVFNNLSTPTADTTYTLIDFGSNSGFSASNFTASGDAGVFSIDTANGALDFTISAVPEASTWVGGVLLALTTGWMGASAFASPEG